MKKGDIVLIPFPFTDLSTAKNRPTLILVVGNFDVTVSFITSQLKWEEPSDLIIEASSMNGLKTTSLIKLGKIATIDKDLVIGKLGTISLSEQIQVDAKLIKLFLLEETDTRKV